MKTIFLLSPILSLATENSLAVPSFTGRWKQDEWGWTFRKDGGTVPMNKWEIIDGKYYYFNEKGYCLRNTCVSEGRKVDGRGIWTKNNKHIIHIYDEHTMSTTIQAKELTLKDTGLCGFVEKDENEIEGNLGKGQPCRRDNSCDDHLYYSYPMWPGAYFNMERNGDHYRKCTKIYGPFAAFFTCSGFDVITCGQLEKELNTPVFVKKVWGEKRHFADFVYKGCSCSIFLCTSEGIFLGNSCMSATANVFEKKFDGHG